MHSNRFRLYCIFAEICDKQEPGPSWTEMRGHHLQNPILGQFIYFNFGILYPGSPNMCFTLEIKTCILPGKSKHVFYPGNLNMYFTLEVQICSNICTLEIQIRYI